MPTLSAYIEYLASNFVAWKSVFNYLSAVRYLHALTGQPIRSLDSFEIKLLLRALPLTMRRTLQQKLPIDPPLLKRIANVCDRLGTFGTVLKVAFLLAFFAFLRQSNLAPSSSLSFDRSRHTCREDVVIEPPGLIVTLRWSKTMQNGTTTANVPVPAIPGHTCDPVLAYQQMLAAIPTRRPNEPLLMHMDRSPVTTRTLARTLKSILLALGVAASHYSLHSFRRGGATASFRAGVDCMNIKRHGTWVSDSFWGYVSSESVKTAPVAPALAAVFT